MNKSELVDALATHFDGSRAEATRALNAFVNTVSSATAAGERVAITGFGVFEKVERPARTVRNPRTGERLDVAATAVPRFRAGTELKAYVAGSRPVPELVAAPAAPTRRRGAPAAEETARVADAPSEEKAGRKSEKAGKPKADSATKSEKKVSRKSDKKSGKASDKKAKGKKK